MRALSLTEPWATLVALGAKRFETRSWSTDYRGPVAIHCATTFSRDCMDLCFEEPFASALGELAERESPAWTLGAEVRVPYGVRTRSATIVMIEDDMAKVQPRGGKSAWYTRTQIQEMSKTWDEPVLANRPRGVLIAVAVLADCIRITEGNVPAEPERSFGNYAPGRFMFRLESARRVRSLIPCGGQLGLFALSEEMAAEVNNAC